MGSNFSAVIFTSAFIGGQRPSDDVDTSDPLEHSRQMAHNSFATKPSISNLRKLSYEARKTRLR
jgi:hypothetical protein